MELLTFPDTVTLDVDLTIRLAQDDDAVAISDMTLSHAVHEFWGGRPVPVNEVLAKYTGRRMPEVVSYVICDRGAIVGYLQAWQREGRFGLDMFVAAASQGHGIGPQAAKALAVELTARGWSPLTVDPAVNNSRAVRAWRAAGFEAISESRLEDGKPTRVMVFAG